MLESTLYNKDNTIIKCDKCSEQASFVMQGEDRMIALCTDHRPKLTLQGELKERPAISPDIWIVGGETDI